jgi:hypothetical protein
MYHFHFREWNSVFRLLKPPKFLKIEYNGPRDLKIDILNNVTLEATPLNGRPGGMLG